MIAYRVYRTKTDNTWKMIFPDGDVFIVESPQSYYGLCTNGPTLIINTQKHTGKLRHREELDTWIHEILHYVFPNVSEDDVALAASKIAAILWEAGYRRQRRSTTS